MASDSDTSSHLLTVLSVNSTDGWNNSDRKLDGMQSIKIFTYQERFGKWFGMFGFWRERMHCPRFSKPKAFGLQRSAAVSVTYK